jgi:homoserine kinase
LCLLYTPASRFLIYFILSWTDLERIYILLIIIMFDIKVPASSANLGPGFDCFGLALQLYLSINVEIAPSGADWQITVEGEGAHQLPEGKQNLIARVASAAASAEQLALPSLRLNIHNDIPFSRGLGSSAAAITAGIAIVEALSGHEFELEKFFHYALQFESHADNLSAARMGGFTLVCNASDGRCLALKKSWPSELKVLVVIPEYRLNTERARAALPENYRRADAVFNMQHSLLLQTAIAEGRLELIGEALNDRFHQPYRAHLIPGLAEALAVRVPGLSGVALSGSGPTLLALATENFDTISAELQNAFAPHGISARSCLLNVDHHGRSINHTDR